MTGKYFNVMNYLLPNFFINYIYDLFKVDMLNLINYYTILLPIYKHL